jgi:hypothetical protein
MGMVSRRELSTFSSFQPIWKKYDLRRLNRSSSTSDEQEEANKKRPAGGPFPPPPNDKSPDSRDSFLDDRVVLEPKLDSRRATRKKAAPLFGKKDHSS